MLNGIRVKNYRGFKDCRVDGLGRVNIFAGMNNSGKTTLLEALFWWATGGSPQFAFNPAVVRVEVPVERVLSPTPVPAPNMMPSAGYMWVTAWQPMFHDLTVGDPIEIVGDHDALGPMGLTISTERAEVPTLYPTTDNTVGHPDDLLFRYDPGGGAEPLLVRLKTRTGAAYEVESSGEFNAPVRAVFEGMHNVAADVERLSKLRVEKADASVLKAIRMLDESVRSIDIVLLDNRAVILADVGLADMVPLQTLGAGPQRVASLATSTATAAGGILLIDEFDAGLHHSKLGDVWRTLHAMAVDNDVQVFATTHSYECVRSAADALGDGEPRFFRLQNGHAVDYPPDTLADAITAGMEVR